MTTKKTEENFNPMLLTVEQAAEIAGIGRTTAYRLIAAGTWRAVKIGRLTRVSRAWLLAWVESLAQIDPPNETSSGL